MAVSTELDRVKPQEIARPEPRSLLEAVMRQVSNPDVDPARLREFLEIGVQLKAIDAKEQFSRSMAEMRPKLPTIHKNGLIQYKPGTKPAPFARWDDIHKACMPILDEHGFSCSFESDLVNGNALKVTMKVKHVGGHEEPGSLVVPWLDQGGSKSPAQAAASSFTLAQRHVFVKYFNILTEDADDNGTGKGVPGRITEDQARNIEDMLVEIENREHGARGRFARWLKAEHHTENIGELFQGDQLQAVLTKLREKLVGLGAK